jgi:hypothetical protein
MKQYRKNSALQVAKQSLFFRGELSSRCRLGAEERWMQEREVDCCFFWAPSNIDPTTTNYNLVGKITRNLCHTRNSFTISKNRFFQYFSQNAIECPRGIFENE